MQYNFIKVSDPETKNKLLSLGYVVLSESGGVTTFLNQTPQALKFDDGKAVYSNQLEM